MKAKALAVMMTLAMAGCASLMGPTRITGLAPIDRVDATGTHFVVGTSTESEVYGAYGVACATQDQFTADPSHYGCIKLPDGNGGTLLQYMESFTVLPGALTDQADADVSDSGISTMTYEFDAAGILRSVNPSIDCSRYIGTVEFHGGCIDRLP